MYKYIQEHFETRDERDDKLQEAEEHLQVVTETAAASIGTKLFYGRF